jgi:hypothetical protein
MLADSVLLIASTLRLGDCSNLEQRLCSKKLEEFAREIRKVEIAYREVQENAREEAEMAERRASVLRNIRGKPRLVTT